MSTTGRPNREELRQPTAGPGAPVRREIAGAGAHSTGGGLDHDFAVIRARACEWRARPEQTVTFADGGEGMGV